MIIWLVIFAYVMIGLIFASATGELDDCYDSNGFFLALFCWPIILILLIVFAVISIPWCIGSILGKLLKKLER